MKTKNINNVLEGIKKLDIEEQEYISQILSKRVIELKRFAISKRAQEAESNYKEGKVKKGSFNDIWADLND